MSKESPPAGTAEKLIRVGALAQRVGLTARTIRYYEERGLLHPARSEGRFRLYGTADIERLTRIRDLRGFGLSVTTIEELLRHPAPDHTNSSPRPSLPILTEKIASLTEQRDALIARIEQNRHELEQAQLVADELDHSLRTLQDQLDSLSHAGEK